MHKLRFTASERGFLSMVCHFYKDYKLARYIASCSYLTFLEEEHVSHLVTYLSNYSDANHERLKCTRFLANIPAIEHAQHLAYSLLRSLYELY